LPFEFFGRVDGSPRLADVLELRRRILTRNGFAHELEPVESREGMY